MHVLEKTKSPLSSLAETVIDQHAANFWLQKFNSLWSLNQPLGKIVQKENAAQNMVSLTIQVNRHFKMGQAGQHHPVFVSVNGIRYERSYSLTQLDSQHVLLTVKKVDQGKVSSWLHEHAQIGDVLEFGQPYGDMLLTPQAQPMVLLAAGSGITPMLSLLKALAKTEQMRQAPIQLLYWVKEYADVAFKTRFEQLAEQYPNFSFQVFYTQEQDAGERLNQEHLALLSDVENSTVYACGPSGFVAQAEQLFADAQSFKSEAFSMSPVESSDVGFVNITLLKSNKVVAIPKGQSILSSLEQQNVKPTYGCRMGICNKCVCNKVEGSTKNLVNGSQNSEPGNVLKICVNSAQSDLVIDL
ncbi:ferredoxin reductase [Acinetobacter bouvetii]|uniref:Stearoyl-CoA 9-desaturase electron transfer partner n=1 Tax=Acinetobacter bouvetii TaxID=202951 RepID=A0A811GAR3_9GAMM|nr:ferredoxin reductase [Acinetobacter bouvetii]CAB1213290.1 Stearoyl-CoA 9-desaturase electron transfer partner [Acinetobacter bouvetii]